MIIIDNMIIIVDYYYRWLEHDPFIDADYFIVELPTKDGYFP